MPTPYAQALVSINGGGPISGGIESVASGAHIAFTPASTVLWQRQRWEIYDYPEGWTAPAGWSTAADGTIFSTDVVPAAFDLPANTTRWGKWMLALRVNEQLDSDDDLKTGLLDLATSLSMPAASGLHDLGALEEGQFCTSTTLQKQWLRALQYDLRIIDTWIRTAGPGSGVPGGSNTQMQFNDAGTFGGAPNATYVGGYFCLATALKLLNSGHEMQLASATLSADVIITFPAVTGTVCLLTATQTVTNKTIDIVANAVSSLTANDGDSVLFVAGVLVRFPKGTTVGHVMQIDGTGMPAWGPVPNPLPSFVIGDADKMLGINDAGVAYEWTFISDKHIAAGAAITETKIKKGAARTTLRTKEDASSTAWELTLFDRTTRVLNAAGTFTHDRLVHGLVTVTHSGVTYNMDPSPKDGDLVICRARGDFTVTFGGNGRNIFGWKTSASTFIQEVNGECTWLHYVLADDIWEVL